MEGGDKTRPKINCRGERKTGEEWSVGKNRGRDSGRKRKTDDPQEAFDTKKTLLYDAG